MVRHGLFSLLEIEREGKTDIKRGSEVRSEREDETMRETRRENKLQKQQDETNSGKRQGRVGDR